MFQSSPHDWPEEACWFIQSFFDRIVFRNSHTMAKSAPFMVFNISTVLVYRKNLLFWGKSWIIFWVYFFLFFETQWFMWAGSWKENWSQKNLRNMWKLLFGKQRLRAQCFWTIAGGRKKRFFDSHLAKKRIRCIRKLTSIGSVADFDKHSGLFFQRVNAGCLLHSKKSALVKRRKKLDRNCEKHSTIYSRSHISMVGIENFSEQFLFQFFFVEHSINSQIWCFSEGFFYQYRV